ncbi:MAG: NAD(P)/FAD-dependent oxidoreductase, partial [Venatoribacter sp.]
MQRIVIVGGGAGGLELATSLGHKLGRKGKAYIELIDANRTHLWKPLLHEVATGALDYGIDGLDYLAHANNHGFRFHLGRMQGLDRTRKEVILEPILDEKGEVIAPERRIHYNLLIMAVGSITNDFGTKGAKEHCFFLDNSDQAKKFHHSLLNEFLRANAGSENGHETLNIGIVGAGATGVELSAELYYTAEVLVGYGMRKLMPGDVHVHLIEAGERILPALPERIASAAKRKLETLGVSIHTHTMVTEVTENGFTTKEGNEIPAKIKVWAAGVRAPYFTSNLGLETNRAGQLVVNNHLQTEDEFIFAIGDCSAMTDKDGKLVPPRAQAAHQQASHMLKVIMAKRTGRALPEYV